MKLVSALAAFLCLTGCARDEDPIDRVAAASHDDGDLHHCGDFCVGTGDCLHICDFVPPVIETPVPACRAEHTPFCGDGCCDRVEMMEDRWCADDCCGVGKPCIDWEPANEAPILRVAGRPFLVIGEQSFTLADWCE